ncbi:unnamed protein product [Lactuca virosa]|uniref:Replication protein A 70 kDa DNA-binding subunit B/D first OB fold domain-containing protein n=1 Tax=Lactuca virosa TaxID=75947 RepID=A0AAU9N0S8_9ASTR|nr:unnamed protein product [Lactuca virosa]
MAHNSGDEIVFDSLADIDASKETWNIRVQVKLWKQTSKNNLNMVSILDMILMDQQGTKMQATIKKIPSMYFKPCSLNELDKINFYKTTIVHVSAPFVNRVDPFNFVTFHDLTARNFDTRVAFDFIGKVVSIDTIKVIIDKGSEKRLMNMVAQHLSGRKIQVALWDGFALKLNSYISEHQNDNAPVIILLRMAKLKNWVPQVGNCLFGSRLHINDDMPHISEFKKVISDMDLNVESSINNSQLNIDIVVANAEDYYLRFPIKNIDDIPDYNEGEGHNSCSR